MHGCRSASWKVGWRGALHATGGLLAPRVCDVCNPICMQSYWMRKLLHGRGCDETRSRNGSDGINELGSGAIERAGGVRVEATWLFGRVVVRMAEWRMISWSSDVSLRWSCSCSDSLHGKPYPHVGRRRQTLLEARTSGLTVRSENLLICASQLRTSECISHVDEFMNIRNVPYIALLIQVHRSSALHEQLASSQNVCIPRYTKQDS
jgi:hypothetical protein